MGRNLLANTSQSTIRMSVVRPAGHLKGDPRGRCMFCLRHRIVKGQGGPVPPAP
jgi:hypothetical protein